MFHDNFIYNMNQESNIIFYTTPNGQVSVQVQYEDGSFWLTQKRMAELFGVEITSCGCHTTSPSAKLRL